MLTAELTPYGIKAVASGRSSLAEMEAFVTQLDALSLRAKKNWRLFVDARDHIVMGQDVFELILKRPTTVPAVAAAYICRDATSTMQISRYLRTLGAPAHRLLVLNGAAEPDADAKVVAFLNSRLG